MADLGDYIVALKGVCTEKLCNALMDEYSGLFDQQLNISHPDVQNNNHYRKTLDAYVFSSLNAAMRRYQEKIPSFDATQDFGYTIYKYGENNAAFDADFLKNEAASIACVVALDDQFSDGGLVFTDNKAAISLCKGDAVIFPSSFMYPHEMMPVAGGTKSFLVTWFR